MTMQFQAKTLVRLIAVLVLVCVATTLLVGPRADAAAPDGGYGVSSTDIWHSASLIEGRSAGTRQ